jgi:hypothetical protein
MHAPEPEKEFENPALPNLDVASANDEVKPARHTGANRPALILPEEIQSPEVTASFTLSAASSIVSFAAARDSFKRTLHLRLGRKDVRPGERDGRHGSQPSRYAERSSDPKRA